MASIACWLVAQLPQIISNIRSKSAEALSPYFLAEWLLVGAYLQFNDPGVLLSPTVVVSFICNG
jgi:uncharacterized protein with PQ loop repeat